MFKKILLSLIIVVTLSACSFSQLLPGSLIEGEGIPSNESENSPVETVSSEPQDELSADDLSEDDPDVPEPNPLKLSISLDQALAVEAEIGPAGGTIEVTAADGAKFILEIPVDALISPEIIRMIPISSIEGLPVDNDQAVGVRLEPSGLVFFKPATLTIQHSDPDDGTIPLGFGTMDEGEDFHLQTSLSDGSESRIFLFHFSNYAILHARREEIRRLDTLYTPSSAQNYAIDQSVVIMELVDDPEAQLDAFEKIIRQWFNNSLITRIGNAAVFDDRLEAALGEYLAWQNMIETIDLGIGFDGRLRERLASEIEQALDGLAAAFINAFERAYSRCLQDNDPDEAFRMYRYGLTASYLELWGRAGLDEEDAKEKLEACFNFEFVFRSKVEGSEDGTEKVSQVLARIPLEIDHASDVDIGGAVLTNGDSLDFEINTLTPMPNYCQVTGKSGRLDVGLIMKLNYSIYQPWSVDEVKMMLIFSERPEETVTCTTQGTTISNPVLWWRPLFQVVNKPFFDGHYMYIYLPIVKEGEVYAELELYGEIPDIPNGQERTKYELLHKPGQ